MEEARADEFEPRARGRILIVDDEPSVCSGLEELLASRGHGTASATSPYRALQLLDEFDPDLVLTDFRMPGLDGFAFMDQARRTQPDRVFIIMTAHSSISLAVEAVKRGAENFIEKPFRFEELNRMIETAMHRARFLAGRRATESREDADAAFSHIVGDHPTMRALYETVKMVAPVRTTVLITGESGTGKGLVADAIHLSSPRREGPFVHLSCAALAESVLESELFGHERGAFTGAICRREGRFMQARGGTLYLDEIGEISTSTQIRLLRVLQEKAFERVGGNETLETDVRVVAATNRDLEEEVAAGRFRRDLFYRLNVVRIHVPPLRERRSDIPKLAMKFLERTAREHGKQVNAFSSEVMARFMAYDWPGNVRELDHAIEHAVVLNREGSELAWLPELFVTESPGGMMPFRTIHEIEREAILNTLASVNGDIAKAAEVLGVSRRKIQYRLREYAD